MPYDTPMEVVDAEITEAVREVPPCLWDLRDLLRFIRKGEPAHADFNSHIPHDWWLRGTYVVTVPGLSGCILGQGIKLLYDPRGVRIWNLTFTNIIGTLKPMQELVRNSADPKMGSGLTIRVGEKDGKQPTHDLRFDKAVLSQFELGVADHPVIPTLVVMEKVLFIVGAWPTLLERVKE